MNALMKMYPLSPDRRSKFVPRSLFDQVATDDDRQVRARMASSTRLRRLSVGAEGGTERYIWEDKEIRFDTAAASLQCREGEFVIARIPRVEDSKGNAGKEGTFMITNLRLIWVLDGQRKSRTNLSIGLNCILNVSSGVSKSMLKPKAPAVLVLSKYKDNRFEFIFTTLDADPVPSDPAARIKSKGGGIGGGLRLACLAVRDAYQSTRLFREVRLRAALLDREGADLKLLRGEEVYNRYPGAWNLSGEAGNLGTFLVTNVRVVWYANLSPNLYNISLPYIQIRFLSVKMSKFGKALVLGVFRNAGGFVLGFRIDPQDKLQGVYREMQSMWHTYAQRPDFGIPPDVLTPLGLDVGAGGTGLGAAGAGAAGGLNSPRGGAVGAGAGADGPFPEDEEEDVEIVHAGDKQDAFVAYYAEQDQSQGVEGGAGGGVRGPVLNDELGLAMEPLREGYTVSQLWDV